MSSDLHEKRAGDEPFESETEIEEAAGEGKGIFGTLHKPVWGEYCEDDLAGMVVRGLQFMSDKKKIDCGPPLYKLMHADIFKTRKEDERMSHFASRKESWAYQRWEKQQQQHQKKSNANHANNNHSHANHPQQATAALSSHPLAPLFVINFLIPGAGFNMNLVLYFARRVRPAAELKKLAADRKAKGLAPLPAPLPHQNSVELKDKAVKHPPHITAKKEAGGNSHSHYEGEEFPHDIDRIAAFDLLLERFLTGDDEFRDCRLKIVPRIAEGSWVVKKSIGRVPAILGKKVKQFYYRDTEKNYMEIDADLGTSMVAGRIISMVKGTCKGMVVDLSFLLQGEGKDELPESLLGGIRMIRVDLDKITFLDENNNKNPPEFDF